LGYLRIKPKKTPTPLKDIGAYKKNPILHLALNGRTRFKILKQCDFINFEPPYTGPIVKEVILLIDPIPI